MSLEKEQIDYIDSLKQTHPDLEGSVLKAELINAEWTEEDITEAVSRYQDRQVVKDVPVAVKSKELMQETPELESSDALNTELETVDKTMPKGVTIEGKTKTFVIAGVIFIGLVAIALVSYLFYIQQYKVDMSENIENTLSLEDSVEKTADETLAQDILEAHDAHPLANDLQTEVFALANNPNGNLIRSGKTVMLTNNIRYTPPDSWEAYVDRYEEAEEVRLEILTPETSLAIAGPESGHIPSDINLNIYPNPNLFSLDEFVNEFEDGWYSHYKERVRSTTGQLSLVTVSEEGVLPSHVVFVELNPNQIVVISSLGRDSILLTEKAKQDIINEVNYITKELGRN